jgi:hypothetical protein
MSILWTVSCPRHGCVGHLPFPQVLSVFQARCVKDDDPKWGEMLRSAVIVLNPNDIMWRNLKRDSDVRVDYSSPSRVRRDLFRRGQGAWLTSTRRIGAPCQAAEHWHRWRNKGPSYLFAASARVAEHVLRHQGACGRKSCVQWAIKILVPERTASPEKILSRCSDSTARA